MAWDLLLWAYRKELKNVTTNELREKFDFDKLEELDFIERVTPPEFMRTPPIPKVEIPQSQTLEENQYDYLLWLIIGGIVIITIGIFKKRKKLKD